MKMTKDGGVKVASTKEIQDILKEAGWVAEKPKTEKPAKKTKK